MTNDQLDCLLAAIIRMEHKCTDSMTSDEYWAAVALAQKCNAPSFITEYFARKANDTLEGRWHTRSNGQPLDTED